jgi:hypothetical protein
MSTSFTLPQNYKIVSALNPATDAAGRTGAYVSLKNAIKATLVVHVTQGNAATIALSLSQATAVAGTGAKAVSATFPIWSNLDTATSDTLVARTAAASYTTDAASRPRSSSSTSTRRRFSTSPTASTAWRRSRARRTRRTSRRRCGYLQGKNREEPMPSSVVD